MNLPRWAGRPFAFRFSRIRILWFRVFTASVALAFAAFSLSEVIPPAYLENAQAPSHQSDQNFHLEIINVQDLVSQYDFRTDRWNTTLNSSPLTSWYSVADEDDSSREPERFIEFIREAMGESCWEDPVSLEVHRGQLIVFQSLARHRALRRLLEEKRMKRGPVLRVETRILTLHDKLCESLGLSRGFPRRLALGSPSRCDDTLKNDFYNPPLFLNGSSLIINSICAHSPTLNCRICCSSFTGNPSFDSLNGNPFLDSQALASSAHESALALPLNPVQAASIQRLDPHSERQKASLVTVNRQRVTTAIVSERVYVSDYELSSGSFGIAKDPVTEKSQESRILELNPFLSEDWRSVTVKVRSLSRIMKTFPDTKRAPELTEIEKGRFCENVVDGGSFIVGLGAGPRRSTRYVALVMIDILSPQELQRDD